MDENSLPLDKVPEGVYDNVLTVNTFLMNYIRHFDGMQTKLRSTALTWLMATFAGVGFFLSTRSAEMPFNVFLGATFVFAAGLISIIPLFILDCFVYQKFLDGVFFEGLRLENAYTWLPHLRHSVLSKHQPGGLNILLTRLYLGYLSILFGCAEISFAVWLASFSALLTTTSAIIVFAIVYWAIKFLPKKIISTSFNYEMISINQSEQTLDVIDGPLFKCVWENYTYVIESLKFYGESLSFSKRLLSTCLLATFVGIGFVVSVDDVVLFANRLIVVPLVCLVGNCGVTLLWMVDLLGYQKALNAVFSEGLKLEKHYPWLPQTCHTIVCILPEKMVPVCMAGVYIYSNCTLLSIGGISLALWGYPLSVLLSLGIAAMYLLAISLCGWFFIKKSRLVAD